MSIVLQGSTSGSITLQEPAVAGSNTISLPAATGTAVLTGVSGTVDINAAGSNNVTLSTNSTERVRVDSSGNVGIGTSSPATFGKFAVVSADGFNSGFSGATTTLTNYIAGDLVYICAGPSSGSNGKSLVFQTGNSGLGSERMRITSGGNICVNTTFNNGALINVLGANTLNGTYEWSSPKGSNNSHMHYGTFGDWYIRPANLSGSVYVRNYVAESDARLKTNIEPIQYGLNDVLALQPKKFNWNDGGDVENNGFIAQEVEAVLPALVSEGQWKSVDYQGITAILVKAIQELKGIVDTQATKIAELEAKLEGTA